MGCLRRVVLRDEEQKLDAECAEFKYEFRGVRQEGGCYGIDGESGNTVAGECE